MSNQIWERVIPVFKEHTGIDDVTGRVLYKTIFVIDDIGCDLWQGTCKTCPYPVCAKHEAHGRKSINKWLKEGAVQFSKERGDNADTNRHI